MPERKEKNLKLKLKSKYLINHFWMWRTFYPRFWTLVVGQKGASHNFMKRGFWTDVLIWEGQPSKDKLRMGCEIYAALKWQLNDSQNRALSQLTARVVCDWFQQSGEGYAWYQRSQRTVSYMQMFKAKVFLVMLFLLSVICFLMWMFSIWFVRNTSKPESSKTVGPLFQRHCGEP